MEADLVLEVGQSVAETHVLLFPQAVGLDINTAFFLIRQVLRTDKSRFLQSILLQDRTNATLFRHCINVLCTTYELNLDQGVALVTTHQSCGGVFGEERGDSARNSAESSGGAQGNNVKTNCRIAVVTFHAFLQRQFQVLIQKAR